MPTRKHNFVVLNITLYLKNTETTKGEIRFFCKMPEFEEDFTFKL